VNVENEKKAKHPSWGPPKIRLDPETHALVRDEVQRIGDMLGEKPRYQDVVRALCRKALRDAVRQVQAELSDGVSRG